MKNFILTIFAVVLSLSSFATIGRITGDSIICMGSPIFLSDTTAGGVWSSSSTIIATVGLWGDVTGMAAGAVTITYTVGTSFVTKTITVYPAPAPINGPSSFCETGSITLYDSTAGGGSWTADWPINIYSSTSNSAKIIASDGGGSGNVYFTDTDGCIAYASVYSAFFKGPIIGDTLIYIDSTTHLAEYLVDGGGGIWSSSNTSVATINSSTGVATGISGGTTTITFSNGCISTTTLTVLLPSGIPFYSNLNENVVYPNPATTSLNITSPEKIASIAITNLIGQTLFSNSYHDNEVQVDVSGLPTGVYFIRINGAEVRKFMKE
jgi:uncharacterized protein YjdB